jgi:hypothetical protein
MLPYCYFLLQAFGLQEGDQPHWLRRALIQKCIPKHPSPDDLFDCVPCYQICWKKKESLLED